jgi:hypothetical protein
MTREMALESALARLLDAEEKCEAQGCEALATRTYLGCYWCDEHSTERGKDRRNADAIRAAILALRGEPEPPAEGAGDGNGQGLLDGSRDAGGER